MDRLGLTGNRTIPDTMAHHILDRILVLLVLAVVIVALFRRLSLPPILGYLFVGMLLGPHASGWLDEGPILHLLGEIGVAFLLFAIGLEFSLGQFWAMRRTLLGLGAAQVAVGTVSGALIAWWIGIPWPAAVVVGGALAMSSTAIVVKQLTDQLELQDRHGQLSLGILLFQDLAAVPFLVMIPILADSDSPSLALPLLWALVKAAAAFGLMLGLGRLLLRPLFQEIAAAYSAELFTLTVLLVSLLAAWLTGLLGLSLALGAFLAGMMLSETEYRHQIETDIRPFKDVLLGLFFVTVGMQLNLAVLPPLWFWIALLVAGVVIGKGMLIGLLALAAGSGRRAALRTGLVLGHGGEFGFALLALALNTGLLGLTDSQPILATVILSMLIAPILVRHNGVLTERVLPHHRPGDQHAREIARATAATRGHVVILGFGRVGQPLARFLRDEQLDYVALDLDPDAVRTAWEQGERVFYGDANHRETLAATGLARASALVISFDEPRETLHILHHARALRRDLPILVRARDDANLQRFLDAGATEVVPETLEASLMLATQLLLLLNVPADRITDAIESIRQRRYLLLRG